MSESTVRMEDEGRTEAAENDASTKARGGFMYEVVGVESDGDDGTQGEC